MLTDEVLKQIAKNGVCYTNEAKAMAKELLELREKQAQQSNPYNYLAQSP